MKVLVVGAGGLIGRAVMRRATARSAGGTAHEWLALDRAACDVTSTRDRSRVLRLHRPDAVVFCAAFTDVDGAARDPRSHAVNALAPAAWAREVETWFLSSNFVFDGPGPHPPEEPPRPGSVYGKQKVEAETGVLAAGGHVVRVGWVWGPGGRTFPTKAEALIRAGSEVQAIVDRVVQPTHADDVARALLRLPRGITHLAGAGETSWYGFALALQARLVPHPDAERQGTILPIRTAELGLGPRPRDARLAPALLPPWWEQLAAKHRQ